MKQKQVVPVVVPLTGCPAPKDTVLANVRRWRRENHLPNGPSKREFNQHFNALGDKLNVGGAA